MSVTVVPQAVVQVVPTSRTATLVVRETAEQIIQAANAPIVLVSQGLPGATGATGAAGAQTITRTASTALSGHTAVAVLADNTAVEASSDSPSRLPIGITTGAAAAGALATIQIAGEVTESSWAWDVTKPVFLGLNGALTQVPPASGMITLIGYPSSPTSFIIEIDSTVIGG